MDSQSQSTPLANKSTGLPRLSSKLPMPQSKLLQASVAKRDENGAYAKLPERRTLPTRQISMSSAGNGHQTRIAPTAKTSGSSLSRITTGARAKTTPLTKKPLERPSIRSTSRTNSTMSRSTSIASSTEVFSQDGDLLSSPDSSGTLSRGGFHDHLDQDPFREPLVPEAPRSRKASRPSLSDRTIESLQSVPSTPKDRQRENFFSPVESPMGPPPRPFSRSSRNNSNPGSRPGTSDGSTILPSGRPASPTKRTTSSANPASRSSIVAPRMTPAAAKDRSLSGSQTGQGRGLRGIGSAVSTPSKSIPAPSARKRPLQPKAPSDNEKSTSRVPNFRSSVSSVSHASVAAADADVKPVEPQADEVGFISTSRNLSGRTVSNPSNASSLALRQQIAAAKAAARKGKVDSPLDRTSSISNDSGIEMHIDPFNQVPRDEKHILKNRINNARTDGRLNIAALGLKQIPDDVLRMYDAAAIEESNLSWAEVVDLSRVNAADNEIEVISDEVFPDKTAEEFDEAEQSHQFGGLEVLDFHGNALTQLPIGLRRLQRLSVLVLNHNKLDNSAMEVISQITTLKDLRLGNNALAGNLPSSICQLENLERLELQGNRLLALPESLRELVSLKFLNVSSNQLTTIPMEALQEVNLVELDASSNALLGSLFPLGGTSGHPTIQALNVANNSLAALSFSETTDLPRLQLLDVTNNHLTLLPPMFAWPDLTTLTAGDNKLSEFPPGFCGLRKLRSANLSSNELRVLSPQIANMESLEYLILASNPLRERKFITMNTQDIKRELKARLTLTEIDVADLGIVGNASTRAESSPTTSWALQPNGLLDLSSKAISDEINDSLGSFLKRHEVRELRLQSNKLTSIPPALWVGSDLRILDMTGNTLGSDYLSDELALPALQELILVRAGLTTLDPLLTHLRAPNLQTLNITANRLSGALPTLRLTYPALRSLFAGDNRFETITADSLRGFHAVSLASNNLDKLPAEIGLLWDEGLRSLNVSSNAFRVPNYRVLDKGTEATLRWLRDRLPASVTGEVDGH